MRTPWTKENDQYLRDNYGVLMSKVMATHLGKIVGQVSGRLNRLGISSQREIAKEREIVKVGNRTIHKGNRY